MIVSLRALWLAEDGASLVEYAIVASMFSALMIAALVGIAANTGTQFTGAGTGLSTFAISPP